MEIDLQIKRSDRSYKYYHRGLRTGEYKTKLIASRDISEECGKGKFYKKNYVVVEYLVMMLKKYDYSYLSI